MASIPTDTQCPCGVVFKQPVRKQGGGRPTIYCSKRCCKNYWIKDKGKEKRKATILRYDNKPENKIKKKLRNRLQTLRKYAWTPKQFDLQLIRQHNECAGCHARIDSSSAVIDHDHVRNVVRGLLCKYCNWALGHIRDNPATMRRLMAYLDRDISKKFIYIIGALKNPRIPDVGNLLRAEGYDVMDEWFTPGEFADLNWQEYSRRRGLTYVQALKGRAATNIFLFDRSYLDMADIAILVMPAGKSAMLELGYAKGRGKRAIIFLDGKDPERYDIMPNFAEVYSTEEELMSAIKE